MMNNLKPIIFLITGVFLFQYLHASDISVNKKPRIMVCPISYKSEAQPLTIVCANQIRETCELIARMKGFVILRSFYYPKPGGQLKAYSPKTAYPPLFAGTSQIMVNVNKNHLKVTFNNKLGNTSKNRSIIWEGVCKNSDLKIYDEANQVSIWRKLIELYDLEIKKEEYAIPEDAKKEDLFLNRYSNHIYSDRLKIIGDFSDNIFNVKSAKYPKGNKYLQLIDLIRLSYIQAVYFSSIDQPSSAKYLGKMMLFTDILVWSNPKSALALNIQNDVFALAKRFAIGKRLGLEWRAFLPETKILIAHEEAELDYKKYPEKIFEIQTLHDYAIRVNSKSRIKKRVNLYRVMDKFTNRMVYEIGDSQNKRLSSLLELLIVSQKDRNKGSAFNANMSTNRFIYKNPAAVYISLNNIPSDLSAFALTKTNIDNAIKNARFAFENNQGAILKLPSIEIGSTISLLKHLELKMNTSKKLFDKTFRIEIEDVYWEIKNTYFQLSKARMDRLNDLGSSQFYALKKILRLYGSSGSEINSEFVASDYFYGHDSSIPHNNLCDEILEVQEKALLRFYVGDTAAALSLLKKIMPYLGKADVALYKIMIYCSLKEGSDLDETLSLISDKVNSGFAKDHFRWFIITTFPKKAGLLKDYLCRSNTASATDYRCQANASFLLEDFDNVYKVCKKYHYTKNNFLSVIEKFARWVDQGESPKDFLLLAQQWNDLVEENMIQSMDIWVDILNDKLKGDQKWLKFKKSTKIDIQIKIMRYIRVLNKPFSLSKAEKIYKEIKLLTDKFEPGDYKLYWQFSALVIEHQVLSHIIFYKTKGLHLNTEEAKSMIVKLVNKTKRIINGEGVTAYKFPLTTYWLYPIIRLGAKPELVADFIRSLGPYYFKAEGHLFVKSMQDKNILTSVVKRLPYLNSIAVPLGYNEKHSTIRGLPFNLKPDDLMKAALKHKNKEIAVLCALTLLYRNNNFGDLKPYFENRLKAYSWAKKNAPNLNTLNRWMWQYDRVKISKINILPLGDYGKYLTERDNLLKFELK